MMQGDTMVNVLKISGVEVVMGRWDDGTMGQWENGKMGKNLIVPKSHSQKENGTVGQWDDGTILRAVGSCG